MKEARTLVDQLSATWGTIARTTMPQARDVGGLFSDITFDCGGRDDLEEIIASDPGFTLARNNRLVALHRIDGEIRYFLGYVDYAVFDVHPRSEIGAVSDVGRAIRLAEEWLEGAELDGIRTRRLTGLADDPRHERGEL